MDQQRLINVIKRKPTAYKLSVYQLLRERAIATSADYAENHLGNAMIFDAALKLWNFCASRAGLVGGSILEFGVFKGRSINHFAKVFGESTVHGFDSLEGLAEDWTGYHLPKGTFDLKGELPKVQNNVVLHKGWFSSTLPKFLEENDEKIRLCHIDCDTYLSSRYVLTKLAPKLSKGSVIIFDEYYGYPNWQEGEFRAWQEVCSEFNLSYDYLAFSEMQVGVIIK